MWFSTMIKGKTNSKLIEKDIGYVDVERNKVVYPFTKKEFPLKPEEEVRLNLIY